MKFNNAFKKIVKNDLENGLIPMLLGEAGIGKSSWVIDLGKDLHTEVFVLACNQLADKADLTGARLVPIQDKDGATTGYKQVFYPHAVIHDAIAYAQANPRETPILFMDELNRTTPDVTSECLSIPTLRSIGSQKLPDNLKVITAGNDKGNITSLDEASITRFVLYHVTPDVQTFLGLDQNLNPFVRSVLEHHPETIFCKGIAITGKADNDNEDYDADIEEILDDGDDMSQITTPRTITGISAWLNKFTNNELMELLAETRTINGEEVSLLQEAIEGHTGKTSFTSFLLGEIAAGLMTTNNQTNAITIPKPSVYDTMKQCATIDELNECINGMSDNEKSGCFVYALYEKTDNKPYIDALMASLDVLTNADIRTLAKADMSNMLDEDNKDAVLRSSSSLAQNLQAILMIQ